MSDFRSSLQLDRQGHPVVVIFILAGLLTIGTGITAEAKLDGGLDLDLRFNPAQASSLTKESSAILTMDYIDGEVSNYPSMLSRALFWPNTTLVDTGLALSGELSAPLFEDDNPSLVLDGYYSSDFGPDYKIGTAGGGTRVSFTNSKLNYWGTKALVNYGGFTYTGVFVVEENHLPPGNYGSGLELGISGTKISGLAITFKTRIGMVPNPLDTFLFNGSGYDVFGPLGRKYEGFTLSEFKVEGIRFGDSTIDTTNYFGLLGFFNYTKIDFGLGGKESPINLTSDIGLAPKLKFVSLNPGLEFEWAKVEVYTTMRPGLIWEYNNEITEIQIRGFGVDDLSIGEAKFNARVGVGDAKLYRRRNKTEYQARASDYKLTPSLLERLFYQRTDYEAVFSLEISGGNLSLALDTYLQDDAANFGFGALTGEMEYILSEAVELSGGLKITADSGLELISFSPTYSW